MTDTRMPIPSNKGRTLLTFGGRVLPVIGALILSISILSIGGAILQQAGVEILGRMALFVPAVFRGQIWRLVTWLFVERDPVTLLFSCLLLYWLGTDLARAWGTRKFLGVFLALGVSTAILTCLVVRFVWPAAMGVPYVGTMAIVGGITIAWAGLFPQREIRLFFVLPVRGTMLIYASIGITAIFAAFSGLSLFIPHLIAEGLMVAHVFAPPPRNLWFRLRRKRHAPMLRAVTGGQWTPGDRKKKPVDKRFLN